MGSVLSQPADLAQGPDAVESDIVKKSERPSTIGRSKVNDMSLDIYRQKRNFQVSPEPHGGVGAKAVGKRPLQFVVQKHRATQLHYDFRLEFRGVLLSWAVPKGPSLDPSVKRLAMHVEDHPLEYGSFEGVIPESEYGGGTVMVWDRGDWVPEVDDVEKALEKGDLKFTLDGKKLRGSWVLVRTRGYGGSGDGRSWLLIKHRDQYASTRDIVTEKPRSVISRRLLWQIARDEGGNVERAATGDPQKSPRQSGAVDRSREPRTHRRT
jgi:bifunctional non-homologous end joining protein LigD